jgi:sec-independent protein translocase protein TatC
MSLSEHFRELRTRLIWALVGWGVGSVVGWYSYEPVVSFMTRPLEGIAETHAQLNFQTISAAFDLKLKVALGAGLLLSSPWWIAQIAIFIGPGLRRGEKLHALVFGAAGAVLFGAGAWSGAMVVPRAVEILISFVPDRAAALIAASSYVTFYIYLVIAFGLSFLLPELLVAANFIGLISGRALLRGWRVATVIAFTFAAIINPMPSPVPMIIQALGLMVLYFAAVLIAWLHDRHASKTAAAQFRERCE